MAEKEVKINSKIIDDLLSDKGFEGKTVGWNGQLPDETNTQLKELQLAFKRKFGGEPSFKKLIPYLLQVGIDNHALLK